MAVTMMPIMTCCIKVVHRWCKFMQYISHKICLECSCFVLLWLCYDCSWIHMIHLLIFFRVASLTLGKSCTFPYRVHSKFIVVCNVVMGEFAHIQGYFSGAVAPALVSVKQSCGTWVNKLRKSTITSHSNRNNNKEDHWHIWYTWHVSVFGN